MGSLPFCFQTIQVVRCPIGPHFTEKKGYPADPKTIGEMIRKRRLDLGLRQIDAAKMIGCDEMSVVNWEKGHRSPRVNHLSGVIEFLGFNPFQNGDTMAHQLINHRKALGMTQKEFAGLIAVDQSTLARWERGERIPRGNLLDRVNRAVAPQLSEPS
jgi:transcriptional regulator with XRE-family HTH domain